MPSYSQSSWPPPARRRLDRYTGRFETSLKAISEAVARKANVDAVSGIHVDDAYTVFCWAGFTRTPWYFRTEFEVAAGTILIGLARYADTFAALVVGSPLASHSSGDTVSSVICGLLIAIGLISLPRLVSWELLAFDTATSHPEKNALLAVGKM